ncbi:uncharacterized protein Z520_07645 [Fonsecaea multimorphosa CBS 102226]|uniref:25S rRNA (Uridine(2843)-N(3))-methyltransferase n=1 Tax=Fonsecaea multimorphosa CBS 102226 TaxID=1442371 RepID=A0A0D2K0G1_9EURO|nr:uncharacterized protein Z520_07645 [Fonsecaea multimorphosa CBS 102226]KIX96379.1 hypothetical protein Z520_07645 [Fonsecaea multimorphosa CBS 102226]OAL22293.1 hypothetical protein AYO22_07337 [Fonsecaea multimorphosa]
MAPARKQKGADSRTRQVSQPRGRGGARSGITTQQRPEPRGLVLPADLQQLILDAFCRAFSFKHNQIELDATIQEVKGHLFRRDFARAFAKPEYLDAYALRWSASRALGYTSIFLHDDLQRVWNGLAETTTTTPNANASPSSRGAHLPRAAGACSVVCIGGGGGAEVAACAATARTLQLTSCRLAVHVIDIADWSACLSKLGHALSTPPTLAPFAAESGAKAANKSFTTSDEVSVRFSQHDILAIGEADFQSIMIGAHLCTIMFTLNELFTASIGRTTAFLLALTDTMSPGSWLLVVDSPGSYSEVKVGSESSATEGQGEESEDANTKARRYPMKWLLDHTLLEVAGKTPEGKSKWRKSVSDDSRWFRLSQQQPLKYPMELENMRYQIHLYQRTRPGEEEG